MSKDTKAVFVDEDTHHKLKVEAAKQGLTIGELVKKLIRNKK